MSIDIMRYGKIIEVLSSFSITCKCGSKNTKDEKGPYINDSRATGSSWTGAYGSLDIICRKCDLQEEVGGL